MNMKTQQQLITFAKSVEPNQDGQTVENAQAQRVQNAGSSLDNSHQYDLAMENWGQELLLVI